ncbi:minor tail protein [Gordonia phage Gaea]|uniref:Minor tail protein n=1 Tax=Gordonia phage Gaea TaxID=2483669 RepID=A0A3G3M9W7_9CAUD|nr:minor tail protein [Gordonia phage Gaea]AYR02844.1 minor tail protein [Gordonia phage Gaea]
MTAPNLGPGSLADYDDVANAVGIAATQSRTAQSWIDEQVGRVAGEVNGVVGWIVDGLETVIENIVDFMTTGETRNLQSAAAFIHDKISDFVFDVIENLRDLWLALTSNYSGDDEWLLNIQSWRDSLFGWVDDVAEFIQNLLDAILRGIRGIPVVGGTIADIIGGVGKVASTATEAQQVSSSAISVGQTTIMNIATNRPLWESPDPTADTSLNWGDTAVTTGAARSVQTTTSTIARITKIRCREDQVKNTISFCAFASSTPTLYVDLFKLDPDTGIWSLLFSSPNIGAQVGVTMQHITYEFSPTGLPVSSGDVYALQFRSSGATVTFLSKTLELAPIPGIIPGAIGGSRNPTSDPAPATISTGLMESYNDGNTLYAGLGSNFGQLAIPRSYYVSFDNYSWQNWVRNDVGGQLAIEDGYVVRTGTTDGHQAAVYGSQTLTDKQAVQFTVRESKVQPTLLYMSSGPTPGPANNVAFLGVTSTGIALGYGTTMQETIEPGSSDWRTGAGTYRSEYDPADNTFRAYKWDGDEFIEILSWVDSSNRILHGSGRRYAGAAIYRALFLPGSSFDNFVLEDW